MWGDTISKILLPKDLKIPDECGRNLMNEKGKVMHIFILHYLY